MRTFLPQALLPALCRAVYRARARLPAWPTLRLPLLLSLLWCLLLLLLYQWTIRREDEYAYGLARLHTATLYANILSTRAWNAGHGGIWVEESERYPANRWIPEEKRSVRTEKGRTLVLVNPAYMTRQLADYSCLSPAVFRIAGLHPVRPGNQADAWESAALHSFANGVPDAFALIPGKEGARFRYMAPLKAEASCLACHQGASVGDLLGGISVSLEAPPILHTSAARKHTAGLAYSFIGLIGILGIGGATLQINRKKEQAEAANKMKSAFLANMSHDMRTPLTGILGMAELLERESPDERQRSLLANLRAATGNLLDVVDSIMRFSLLEAQGFPAESGPFSLRKELALCLDTLRPACLSKKLRLDLEMADNVPDALCGDSFRLKQALGNLLGNAVKFTREGFVRLALSCPEQDESTCLLHFCIIDTGKGIPVAEQNRIFESFVQGDEEGRQAREEGKGKGAAFRPGMGLGLSSARQIARRMGGDVSLSSQEGQGSQFTMTARFRLQPCVEQPRHSEQASEQVPERAPEQGPDSTAARLEQAPPRQAAAELPDLTGWQVLVAEDTPVTALFLREALACAGADVLVAQCGEAAFEMLCRIRPDMALLDVRMPGKSGLEILADIRQGRIRNIPPDLPVLLLSATQTPEQSAEAKALGADGQLLKPIPTEKLLRAVAAALPPRLPRSAHYETHLDMVGALDDLDGNKALWKRLCTLFLDEAEAFQADLRRLAQIVPLTGATQNEACQELRCLAHRLKNEAATLHLPSLQAACARLEETALAGGQNKTAQTRENMTDGAAGAASTPLALQIQRVLAAFEAACAAIRESGD